MRTRIKFCGLVRPEDIDHAVALGVDGVGFVFYERSPRHLSFDEAAALRRRLPSFVAAVGLFVNAPAEHIEGGCRQVGLDIVQCHGDERPTDCEHAGRAARHWWRAVRMRAPGDLLESHIAFAAADALLLDAFSEGYGGSGQRFDWSWVAPLPGRRIVLSGGLDAEGVGEAITRVRPYAVDVSSGIQGEHARCKDHRRMERFVQAVVQADARGRDGNGLTLC